MGLFSSKQTLPVLQLSDRFTIDQKYTEPMKCTRCCKPCHENRFVVLPSFETAITNQCIFINSHEVCVECTTCTCSPIRCISCQEVCLTMGSSGSSIIKGTRYIIYMCNVCVRSMGKLYY